MDYSDAKNSIANLVYGQIDRILQLISQPILDLHKLGMAVMGLKALLSWRVRDDATFNQRWQDNLTFWTARTVTPGSRLEPWEGEDDDAYEVRLRMDQFEALTEAACRQGVIDTRPVKANTWEGPKEEPL